MRKALLVGLILSVTVWNAEAQQRGGASTPDPSESVAAAPGYFDVAHAFEQWNAESGGLWRMHYERRTQAASFIFGGSRAGSFEPRSDAEFFLLAREFLAQTSSLHRVDSTTLVESSAVFLPLGNAGSTDKLTVRFEQQVDGVPVIGGSVNVLFNMQGHLLSIDIAALPGLASFDTLAVIAGREARNATALQFRSDTGVSPGLLDSGELKILMNREGKHLQPRLVWEVNAQWQQPDFEEMGWRYRYDARDGTLLGRVPSVHSFDVSGTVTSLVSPGSDPDSGTNAVSANMPTIKVTSPQGNAVTDIDGNFTIVGATEPVQLTVDYTGNFAFTASSGKPDYSLTTTLTAASGNVVVMNPTAPEFDTAEANAYNWISLMRDWTVSINPADTTSDFLAFASVNQTSTCNASFNGAAVNFRINGGGCVNSSYSSVVLHEMGHWLNERYGSGNGPDGFGEGNSDIFSIFVLDDPIVGKDFGGTGSHIRDAENANLWCGNSCYGQVHADGEPLMGAAWNVRKNLKTTHGDVLGRATANTLFNSWMNAYDDGNVGPIIRDHWLVLDDNNGNVNDGTPNFADIDGGFVQQGFPPFQITYVNFANVIKPADTQSEAGPYTVQLDVTPEFNPPVLGATLSYRVDGGPYVQVPMTFVSGDTYTADIPGQLSPARVEWFVDGSDGGANSNSYPSAVFGGLEMFEVGLKTEYFADDFESGVGGWTHGLIATQDDWMRSADQGAPNGSFGKAGDPAAAYSGTNIWGNDLGPAGFNGLYADNVDNWLRSPALDLSGSQGAKLRFRRWLTVEDGIFDQARVLVNGTQLWVNPVGSHTLDTAWSLVEFDLSAFDGNPSVTVEFTLQSDAGLTFGGWNIDDVEIVTLSATGGGTGVAYCTAGTSGSGCQATVAGSGVPSATAGSGFQLRASTVEGSSDGLFFFSANGRQARPWGNGSSFQCVVPPLIRTSVKTANGTPGSCNGIFTEDLNARWMARPSQNPGVGAVVQAQLWYLDPTNTSNQSSSFSDALEFTVAP